MAFTPDGRSSSKDVSNFLTENLSKSSPSYLLLYTSSFVRVDGHFVNDKVSSIRGGLGAAAAVTDMVSVRG